MKAYPEFFDHQENQQKRQPRPSSTSSSYSTYSTYSTTSQDSSKSAPLHRQQRRHNKRCGRKILGTRKIKITMHRHFVRKNPDDFREVSFFTAKLTSG